MTSRILVVEDEPDIQTLIVEELVDEGYEVQTANNGQEGLDAIRSFKPHLVLSDITMPVMSGHDMLLALREHYPSFRAVPIVFLSALADRRHIIEGKRLGVDDYLTKPIDFELLLVTVEARIREVNRMTMQKEEQMLRLYESLIAQPEIQSKPRPALIVANQWVDLDILQEPLKKIGVPFVTHHRGSQLDDYLNQKKYSAVLFTDQTNDMSAKRALMQSKSFIDYQAPKVLFIEDEDRAQDMSYWGQFRHVISMKTPTVDIAELLADTI